VRPTSQVEELRRLGVALFPGDLADRASMREGMSGADWVIHAAAELDPTAPTERMQQANATGSEHVASLAFKLGVPPQLPYPTPYSATKHAGEAAIRAWAARGLRVNVVYPSLVYGPPGKRGGTNSLLKNLARGRFPALIGAERKASWVFLADLVEGMVAVMERALPGRDYLLTGDVTTVRSLAERVCALAGIAAPRRNLSPALARVALAAASPLLRLLGRRPPLPPQQVRSLDRHWAFDDRRAREELGWTRRSLDEGLPPTIAFLLAPRQAEAA
jgi:nucleoside-diphosphate-sugar epimerase